MSDLQKDDATPDIVERLRDGGYGFVDERELEAAAEIERLRTEVAEYKEGFKEAMTDHAATLERLADCERQRDEPCGFKGDEPTCLVASRLKARLEERERELEYAYRVVHRCVVLETFDFSILRVRAALFVKSKDGQCSLGSAGGET